MKPEFSTLARKRLLMGLVVVSIAAYSYLMYENKRFSAELHTDQIPVPQEQLVPSIIVIKKVCEQVFHWYNR